MPPYKGQESQLVEEKEKRNGKGDSYNERNKMHVGCDKENCQFENKQGLYVL